MLSLLFAVLCVSIPFHPNGCSERILPTLFDLWYYIYRMDKGFYLNEIGDKVSYMLIGVFYPLGLRGMLLSGPTRIFCSININECL